MSFSRVRGQEAAVGRLRAAMSAGRLAHAYLFTGPAGVGKRTLAGELARAALCEAGRKDDACDQCASCRSIDRDSNWDYFTLVVEETKGNFRPVADSDREIKVGSIRALEREFSVKARGNRIRVCLISGADRMNEEAQNALLKTLEEPTGSRLLILTSARPEGLLPTVTSRVARVRLRPLSADEITGYLVEEGGREEAEARELAAAADGSIGAALAASLEGVRAARRFAAERLGRPAPGGALKLSEAMMDFARQAAESEEGKGLEPVRRGLLGLLDRALEFYRQALWISLGASDPAGPAGTDRGREVEGLAALGPDRMGRRLEAVLRAGRAVRGYAPPELVCRVLAGELTSN